MHAAPRIRKPRRVVVTGGLITVVALLAGAGTYLAVGRGPTAAQIQAKHLAEAEARAAALRAAQDRLLSTVNVTPTAGATNVPLSDVVTVSTGEGWLRSVSVASVGGAVLTGALQPVTGAWFSSTPLAPSTTYTVTVVVADGSLIAQRSWKFTTVTPTALVSASVWPTTGMTVGVGQPIVLSFNQDISSASAQKAVESRLTVAESQPVAGGWYWFSEHELHFRPQSYWPANEQVKITGDLDDVALGGGMWTTGQVSETFAIGDARISYANLETERMVVTENGKTIYDFPISGGRPQYPTMGGDHIVLDRESVVHMVSSTVGIPVNSPNGYDEYVYQDVHISDSGEYVHAAPWSVYAQGSTNVSHGCINLSPADAQLFYNFSRVGDVVEVTGSARPPVTGDHGVMDWSTSFSQWAPANVVALN